MEPPPILHLRTDGHGCMYCHRKHHFVNPYPSRRKSVPASIPRGTKASRIYLQVPLDNDLKLLPYNRIWEEIDARFGVA